MTSSSAAAVASAPMASNPLASAISAGDPPEATMSASTALAWVAVSSPPVSILTSAARSAGLMDSAPSTARFCSMWVSTLPALAPGRRHGRQGRVDAGHPLVAGVERHQVGLGEVAVVLRLLLDPQRAGAA